MPALARNVHCHFQRRFRETRIILPVTGRPGCGSPKTPLYSWWCASINEGASVTQANTEKQSGFGFLLTEGVFAWGMSCQPPAKHSPSVADTEWCPWTTSSSSLPTSGQAKLGADVLTGKDTIWPSSAMPYETATLPSYSNHQRLVFTVTSQQIVWRSNSQRGLDISPLESLTVCLMHTFCMETLQSSSLGPSSQRYWSAGRCWLYFCARMSGERLDFILKYIIF